MQPFSRAVTSHKPSNVDLLENRTIRLRAPEPEDLDLLYRWENDSSIWNVSGTLVPYSRYVLKQFIEQAGKDIHETRQLRLIIQLKAEGRPVGAVDLFDFDSFHRRAGIGILIADQTDRRKGYAREALASLLDYCFDMLKLHQVYCNIASGNRESLRLFASSGFTPVGEKKEWLYDGTGFGGEWLYQCIRPPDR